MKRHQPRQATQRSPRKETRDEAGVAMIAAVFFAVVAIGMSVAVLSGLPVMLQSNEVHVEQVQARYQNAGAIQRAVYLAQTAGVGSYVSYEGVTQQVQLPPSTNLLTYINAEPSGSVVSRTTDLYDGTYVVEAAAHVGDTVTGTGQHVGVSAPSRYPGALFLATTIAIKPLLFTDSWDSSVQTYSTGLGTKGHIFANGDMSVSAEGGSVSGDVRLGPDAVLTTNGISYMGITENLSQPHEFVNPLLPEVPTSPDLVLVGDGYLTPGQDYKSPSSLSLPAGQYVFGLLQINAGPLHIGNGHVDLFVNKLHLKPGTYLQVTGTGSLTIYATTEVEIQGTVVNERRPVDLKAVISGPKSSFFWHPDAVEFVGIIDADAGSHMKIDRDLEIWGAMRGGYLDCAAELRVHYDESLGSLSNGEDVESEVLSSWYLTE